MKKYFLLITLLIAPLFPTQAATPEGNPSGQSNTTIEVPRFTSGDRWCVLGDSITHGGQYHKYIELFYLTRFPSMKLDVINCGISGDRATGAEKRVDWDCLHAKPTVVSVMLGMNDVNRELYSPNACGPDIEQQRTQAAQTYEASMRRLLPKLRDSGAKVICVLPTPYDDTADVAAPNLPGCHAALAGYGKKVADMAREFQFPTVDFYTPLATINSEKQKIDPHFSIIGTDRVHPKEPGHFIMATQFLKTQHLEGVVSRIDIDAKTNKTGTLENCDVQDLKVTPDGVTFTCLEKSLPFPVSDAAKPALGMTRFMDEFNQEILRVNGLAKGDYELKIDGKPVRNYSSQDLAAGVNLAIEKNTPQFQQAIDVNQAMDQKWNEAAKIRTIAYVEFSAAPDATRPIDPELLKSKMEAQLAAAQGKSYEPYIRDQQNKYLTFKANEAEYPAKMESALAAARAAAIPKPHQFSLQRVAASN